MNPQTAKDVVARIREEMQRCVVGQSDAVDHVLASFVAGGHVLLEGVPGVGKTMIVLALARAIGGTSSRVQFTPDLMPSDVTGHMLLDRGTGQFLVRKGPIFANLILADEINRAPAKTQAALLEVMQEQQVTIEGTAHPVPHPFMVVATQNPIEQEGTYPLPEAQVDRFLVKVYVDYPDGDDEVRIVRRVTTDSVGDRIDVTAISQVCDPEQALAIRGVGAGVTVDDQVVRYAVEIARETRRDPGISVGAGPRAAIGLVRLARAMALVDGREFVIPDDIRSAALPVLRHRVSLTAALEIEGVRVDDALRRLIDRTPPPRR